MKSHAATPPHAPHTGLVRRLLGPVHVTGVFWYRFHRFGVTILPRWGVGIFLTLFTTFFFLVLFRIRRAIARNLEVVLGPCGPLERQRRIFRTMWNFAWCLSERYEQTGPQRAADLRLVGEEYWREAPEDRKGVIVATAHMGNWEVGSMIPSAQEGRTVHVVREEEMDPVAQQFVEQLLSSQGNGRYVTHFAGREDTLGVALLEAIRREEIVALQVDRPRINGRAVTELLFGRPFPFPEGPFALARSAGVPLVPVFIVRQARLRYEVVVRPPIRVARSADRAADLREAVRRVRDDLEWAIRRWPHQWFVFGELWPDREDAPPPNASRAPGAPPQAPGSPR